MEKARNGEIQLSLINRDRELLNGCNGKSMIYSVKKLWKGQVSC